MVANRLSMAAPGPWNAIVAGVLVLFAGCLLAGPAAAAPKPKVVEVTAAGKLRAGSQYIVSTRVQNSLPRPIEGRISISLSKERKPGQVILGGRRVTVLAARSTRNLLAVATLKKSVKAGKYFLVSCFTGGGGTTCAARPATVVGPGNDPNRPAYGVGAQTVTPPDPVYPKVGNSGYDVRHYNITLNYDHVANRFLAGTSTEITAVNTQGTGLYQFSLDFSGPSVTAVRVNGAEADFWRETGADYKNKLVVEPATKIRRGATFVTEVVYSGVPVSIIDPDHTPEGWLRVDTPGFEGSFVVNEPIGSMSWFPNNNTPSDKATFEFHNTVSTDRVAIANGELDSRVDNGDGTWTWNWSMAHPMATYLSTSSVGNFDYTGSTGLTTGLPLYNAISNNNTIAQKTKINETLARLDAIIASLETRFGVPYPFGSAGAVVDQLRGVGYVLEVQSKIHFPTRNVSAGTLAHETAHQWFGDSVTGPNWHSLWLHEGWATWAAWWWERAENGSRMTPAKAFTDNYTRGSGKCPGSNKWCLAPARVTGESLFSDFPTYIRPAMMFEAQRQIMGKSAFRKLITQWQTRYRYGNAGRARWESLTKEMDRKARGARWDRFFSQWLDGSTMPTINPGNFSAS